MALVVFDRILLSSLQYSRGMNNNTTEVCHHRNYCQEMAHTYLKIIFCLNDVAMPSNQFIFIPF